MHYKWRSEKRLNATKRIVTIAKIFTQSSYIAYHHSTRNGILKANKDIASAKVLTII